MRIGSSIRALATVGLAAVLVFAATSPAAAARPDRTAPSQPTNLRATAVTHTTITVAWSPSTDNVGVRSYTLWVEGLYLGVVSVNYPQTTATWSLGLRPGRTYTVRVQAWDAAYNGSALATLNVTQFRTLRRRPCQVDCRSPLSPPRRRC